MTDRTTDAVNLQVIINAPDIKLGDALEHETHVQIKHILRHVAHQLTRVEAHFDDQNGPKQGNDKRVLLEARIRGQDPIVAEDVSDDWYASVKSAAEKLERALRHHFGKLEDKKRG